MYSVREKFELSSPLLSWLWLGVHVVPGLNAAWSSFTMSFCPIFMPLSAISFNAMFFSNISFPTFGRSALANWCFCGYDYRPGSGGFSHFPCCYLCKDIIQLPQCFFICSHTNTPLRLHWWCICALNSY